MGEEEAITLDLEALTEEPTMELMENHHGIFLVR
jgi:hypothetical protein